MVKCVHSLSMANFLHYGEVWQARGRYLSSVEKLLYNCFSSGMLLPLQTSWPLLVPLRKGHQIEGRWHCSCKFSHMNWVNAGALIGCRFVFLFVCFLTWLISLMRLLLCLIKFITFYIIFLCLKESFRFRLLDLCIFLLIQTRWLFMDKGRKGVTS